MPKLLSGSVLKKGTTGTYINLPEAMFQIPPSPTIDTGYTLIVDSTLTSHWESSLGNIQFSSGTLYSYTPDQSIRLVGTGTGTVIVLGSNQSTSTNTGALVVGGGVGISGCLNVGGKAGIGDSLNVVGTSTFISSSQSTSTNTGAVTVTGGVGIGGNLNLGGTLSLHSTANSFSTTTGALVVAGGAGFGLCVNIGGAVFIGTNSYINNSLIITAVTTSTLAINNTTTSIDTASGALKVAGGVGIGGCLNVGGAAFLGTDSFVFGNIIVTAPFGRVFTVTNTTQSISTDTGAIVVRGGVGIGKNINVGGSGKILSTASSTSTNTGALVVGGGLGLGENLYIGGLAQIFSTASSTSTNTGALVVGGGVGVGGSIWAAQDIHVNCITIGRGTGTQNIIIAGTSTVGGGIPGPTNSNIKIGLGASFDVGANNTNTIAIGNNALGVATCIGNTVAIGNCSLTALSPNTQGNVAIGYRAGKSLLCGTGNVLLGNNAAPTLQNGNYNFIFGPCATQSFTHGDSNISINGDTLQDGQSNQISLGAVFYYNGQGETFINSNVQMGQVGTPANPCGACCAAALLVVGGAVVSGNLFVGNVLCGLSANLTVQCNTAIGKGLTVGNNISVAGCGNNAFAGSITVCGGLCVKGLSNFGNSLIPTTTGLTLGNACHAFGALYLSGQTLYLGTVSIGSPDANNITITSPAGFVTATMGSLILNSGIHALGGCTGALQIVGGGGACISGDLYVCGHIYGAADKATHVAGGTAGSLLLQAAACNTTFLAPGNLNTVLISNGCEPFWGSLQTVVSGYSVSAANSATFSITATNALNSYVYPRCGDATLYVPLVNVINGISPEIGDPNLTYVVTTGTSSGAVIWNSGTSMLNVPGSIYSNEGNSQENNLLYTPRVLVGDYTVLDGVTPRVGDFWADQGSSALYQYINDAGNAYWLQITVL